MAGIKEVSSEWIERTRPNGPWHCLVQLVRSLVQYNAMAFIGVCGSAQLSGATNHLGVDPLDLLQGTTIRYIANTSAKQVSDNATSTKQEFLITTGCALGISFWQDTPKAASFSVTKNHADWLVFAEHNSRSLEAALLEKGRDPEWFFYRDPGNGSLQHWAFSLAGYIFHDDVGAGVKVQGFDRFFLVHSFVS